MTRILTIGVLLAGALALATAGKNPTGLPAQVERSWFSRIRHVETWAYDSSIETVRVDGLRHRFDVPATRVFGIER